MIALLTAVALFSMQQGDTIPGVSPVVRAMLSQFPPPSSGVAIDARFSRDTVWIGEQVDLVTAAWFPRDLRDRLRRPPTLRAPALEGLWSAPANDDPELAETRRVGSRVFDLFVSHQTLFPLTAGAIEAPPAVLTYAVPASSSFFAPEDRKSLSSSPVSVHVRAIPASLVTSLGSGPTAKNLAIRWSVPPGAIVAGVPVTVELRVNGIGNVNLWPEPEILWPGGVRIYPEPTEEEVIRPGGRVQGVKHFQYTLVADSAGVLTLPRIRYPHFDPDRMRVYSPVAPARGLVIRPAGSPVDRVKIEAATELATPLPARAVASAWPGMILLALLPLVLLLWPKRLSKAVSSGRAPLPAEVELKMLLGMPGNASPELIEDAMRRRGVPREQAASVRTWLGEVDRRRWGNESIPEPEDGVVRSVVDRLKNVARAATMLLLVSVATTPIISAQWSEGVEALADGDPVAAESLFVIEGQHSPGAPEVWLNLGVARWRIGDDVGSAAAWLRGATLAPRNIKLKRALDQVTSLPNHLRRRVPTIPLSTSELMIVALASWLLSWLLWRRRRTAAQLAFALTILAGATAVLRTATAGRNEGLVRR